MLNIRKAKAKESDGSHNGQQDPRNAEPLNTEGLDPSEIAFYAALQRAFLTDLNNTVLNSTTLLKDLAQNYAPQDKFEEIKIGQPIHFINKANGNIFTITKDSISFTDQNKQFSFTDAMDMAKFAALDISMQRDGITLEGSDQERALLQAAIETINKSLPNDKSLRIHNKLNPLTSLALRQARNEAARYTHAENTNFSKQQREEETPEEPETKPVNPNTVTDSVYKQVKRHVLKEGVATRKFLKEFLDKAGFEGSGNQGYRQVADRLDIEGVTALNEHGNRRIVLKGEFQRAAVDYLEPYLKTTSNIIDSAISRFRSTVSAISTAAKNSYNTVGDAINTGTQNLKNTVNRAVSSPVTQNTMKLFPS